MKILVIDEVQSLRHQEGHKLGYLDGNAYKEVCDRFDKAHKEWDSVRNELVEKYGMEWQNMSQNYDDYAAKLKDDGLTDEEIKRCLLYREECFQATSELNAMEALPPPAPFRKNWHELCMKRMLRYAAEEGYSWITWTTGNQQIERYKLNREIRSIYAGKWMSPEQGSRYLYGETAHSGKAVTIDMNHNIQVRLLVDNDGNILDFHDAMNVKEWKGMNLSKVLGDALACQVMKTTDSRINNFERIKFGGEGLINLYDKMIPQFMNRFAKRFGIGTRSVLLNLDHYGQTFHGLEMTPAMRASLTKSQPMFMRTPEGRVYGWALDDTIYLTRKGINAETAIHEYTHLWANTMRLKDKHAWEHIKSLLRGTPVWTEVMKDPNYRHIHKNEDEVASEALARVSGRQNMEKLEQAIRQATTRDTSLRGLQQVRQALDKFWSWVGRHVLNIRQARTITDVTDRILGDLLRGRTVGQQYPSTGTEETPRISFRR